MNIILNPNGWVVVVATLVLFLLGPYAIGQSFERNSPKWWIGLLLYYSILGAVTAFIRTGSVSAMLIGAILVPSVASLLYGAYTLYRRVSGKDS